VRAACLGSCVIVECRAMQCITVCCSMMVMIACITTSSLVPLIEGLCSSDPISIQVLGLTMTSLALPFLKKKHGFYYCSKRNKVVVLFGTLKVQPFVLTELSDCGLLIVVTSSTFLKRTDM